MFYFLSCAIMLQLVVSSLVATNMIEAAKCSDVTHEAMIVDLGEEARVSCSSCKSSSKNLKQSRLWFKLERQRGPDDRIAPVWRSVELELDMHDDERLNRVFVLPNHTLVIRDFQPDDVGTYFCEPPARHDRHLAFSLPDSGMELRTAAILGFLRQQEQVNVTAFFHLDIEIPMTKSLVSMDGLSYSLPTTPLIKGRCMVQMVDTARPVAAGHIKLTLDIYPKGAPCHSSLFRGLQEIVRRPAEVELGKCSVPCSKGEPKRHTLMDSRIKVAAFATTPKPVEKIKKDTLVGSQVQLYCPGAKSNDAVQWMNRSRLIQASRIAHETDGRVTVDILNLLRVNKARLTDSGLYSCWVNNRKAAEITLEVTEPAKQSEIHFYFALLTLVYVVNFVVFLGIMVMNHRQRQVQLLKPTSSKDLAQRSRSSALNVKRSGMAGTGSRMSRTSSNAQRSRSSALNIKRSGTTGTGSSMSRTLSNT